MMIYYLYIHIHTYIFQPDDGRTTETCNYVYISNISSYDIKVAEKYFFQPDDGRTTETCSYVYI
jgi:hypothetical protein